MAFHEITALPGCAEQKQINDRLADAHVMMRLPLGDLEAGCNYSVVDLLLAVVSGVSTRLYPSSLTGKGELFKNLLIDHYPWANEPAGGPQPNVAADILWKQYRNPLTHALGMEPGGGYSDVKVIKNPRTEAELEAIELNPAWPTEWDKPTLFQTASGIELRVKCLYWGVRRMIESVAPVARPTGARPNVAAVSATASTVVTTVSSAAETPLMMSKPSPMLKKGEA
ncbi:MAG: hypothetical protein RIM84_20915 [Alphaproteobacteria bacterium]